MRGGAFFNGKEGRDDFRKTSFWLALLAKRSFFLLLKKEIFENHPVPLYP